MLIAYFSDYMHDIVKGIIWVELVIIVCVLYAYTVNKNRSNDDPKKKQYYRAAVFLAPLTWPFMIPILVLLLTLQVTLFVMRSILFGVFLIFVALALVGIRKPFILIWLDAFMTFVGEKLLRANTLLIRVFLMPGSQRLQAA